jgi:hypothetical protein
VIANPWLDSMLDVISLLEAHGVVTRSQAVEMRTDCERLDRARGETFLASLRAEQERKRQMTRWQRFKEALL